MPEDNEPPLEQKQQIDDACTDAALDAAVASLSTNRFEVIPHPDGGGILVLGSVIAGAHGRNREEATPFVKVKMHGAYQVNRTLAADLAAKLHIRLQLTDEEVKEALARNTAADSTDA